MSLLRKCCNSHEHKLQPSVTKVQFCFRSRALLVTLLPGFSPVLLLQNPKSKERLPHIKQMRGQKGCRYVVLSSSRAQISGSSAHCCSANGTPPKMLTMAAQPSSLTAAKRGGGSVIGAQMAILTSGKQHSITGQRAQAVLTVLTELSVATTPLPPRLLLLLLSSVTITQALHMTTCLAATRL